MEAGSVMSGESALSEVFSALWFILPAYLANASALVVGGGPALDGGRNFRDGRRILGDGVTIRGTAGGIVVGTLVGTTQGIIEGDPQVGLLLGLAMGSGAMLGDSLGSFTKRRLGIPRGQPAFLLDQLGFLVVALAFAAGLVPISFLTVIILLVLTPLIHLGTNAAAYLLGMKSVWH